ncbi:hypothetical protein PFLUV_G00021320 [Perca fluviatilis]|uniref:Uncharacterized protein n=1 Tax=Perca fluviatilis TaxID=8168 RepID=A0A6A5FEV6_PERFL|nr:hypothetical protein PFLUV_G00021320 [Perca fluviatilis]
MGDKPVDEIVENNTLYWLFSWCVTSVCLYVKHGRSALDGYFRSGPCPWRPQRAGQQQEGQLLIDAAEKKCHNREVSRRLVRSYQRSSTTGTHKNICFLFFLFIESSQVQDQPHLFKIHPTHLHPSSLSPFLRLPLLWCDTTMDRSAKELFLNFMIVLITVLLMWLLVKVYQD